MGIVDAVIILILLAGLALGFKRGFTKQLLSFLGVLLVVVLAFIFKNPVSIFLYEHLPFFKFGGVLKGVTVLNIILYEILAFLFIAAILMIALRLLKLASSIFEKILNFTIILGIPSKILGAIVGFIEAFIWVFIGLYVLTLPMFHIDLIEESKLKDDILKSTPILSNFTNKTRKVIGEFGDLKKKYETSPNANEFNKETLDLFLKYKVITLDSVNKLIEKNKLSIEGVEDILNCYKSNPTGICKH